MCGELDFLKWVELMTFSVGSEEVKGSGVCQQFLDSYKFLSST